MNKLAKSAAQLIDFFHLAERLKILKRNSKTSENKYESIADHCWRLSIMALLVSEYIKTDISIEKTLKLAIIHDLAEAITGDIPYFLTLDDPKRKQKKYRDEKDAMTKICKILPEKLSLHLFELWEEYELGESAESKLVKALDKMEAQLQHNEAPFSHWNEYDKKYAAKFLDPFCEHEHFLVLLKELIQNESKSKISENSKTQNTS